MWPFHQQVSWLQSGLFRGFTESHCHLLPGVDDGVKTLEESLEVLAYYEQLGISTVWLTPHIMEDIPNTPQFLRERLAVLRQAYQGPIALHLAAENMLDRLLEERLQADDLLPMGEKQDMLLVETSYFNPPVGMDDLLRQIQSKGYYPLLAHPERYLYMGWNDYLRLKRQGIRFQLNLPSLVGGYGREVQAKAIHLLRKGCYNVVGTDTHSLHALSYWVEHRKVDKKLVGRLLGFMKNEE